jgi:hypothetical protein
LCRWENSLRWYITEHKKTGCKRDAGQAYIRIFFTQEYYRGMLKRVILPDSTSQHQLLRYLHNGINGTHLGDPS